jgi:hypothetical protein
MKIDLESSQFFTDLGVSFLLAWLTAGCQACDTRLVFDRNPDLSIQTMHGTAIDHEPSLTLDSTLPNGNWQWQLSITTHQLL